MSKKLLSEAQVRRFQNLASIKPLQEMGTYKRDEKMEEGDYNEGMYNEEEQPMQEEEAPEMPEMDDAPEEAPEMEMDDADGEQIEVEEEMVEKAIAALGDIQALVDALGGEAAPEGDMPDMEMSADEPEMDMGAEEPAEEEELLELALEGINYQPSQKEIVKEVAKRVARRLQEAKKAQANLDKAMGKK